MKFQTTLFLLLGILTAASAQKTVYIPAYLQDGGTVDGSQFSMDKTAESDNFIIIWGTYTGAAVIRDQAFAENLTMSEQAQVNMRAKVSNYTLSGNIEVGGDVVVYNETGDCDNGVYYRMTNYYQNNLLECDGRTASHPVNQDVNSPYTPFSAEEMAMTCNCDNLPDCLTPNATGELDANALVKVFPNPASDLVHFQVEGNHTFSKMGITLYNAVGVQVKRLVSTNSSVQMSVLNLPKGIYLARIVLDGRPVESTSVMIK